MGLGWWLLGGVVLLVLVWCLPTDPPPPDDRHILHDQWTEKLRLRNTSRVTVRATMIRLRLKMAILSAGKTQRQTAAETGVLSENKLSEIVRGWTEPTLAEKQALAAVLRQPLDILFMSGLSD